MTRACTYNSSIQSPDTMSLKFSLVITSTALEGPHAQLHTAASHKRRAPKRNASIFIFNPRVTCLTSFALNYFTLYENSTLFKFYSGSEHRRGERERMWHEARKQEKKIREAVVDFQKRAERRRQHYAKQVGGH